MRVRGHLYRRGSSRRVDAALVRDGDRYRLVLPGGGVGSGVRIRRAADRLKGVRQAVTFEDGRRFLPFGPLPEGFLGGVESGAARWIDWLERPTPVKAVVFLAALGLAFAALRAALPAAADLAAAAVPQRVESAIGRLAFREIDGAMLSPTHLSQRRRAGIAAEGRRLARLAGIDPPPDIRFRRSWIGANAFALPGGPILVTDRLVEALGDDLVVAVIAHELGHVKERHGLRQVLRGGGILLLSLLVVGADETLMEELAALAAAAGSAGYSRGFERDADAFAQSLLAAAGRRPGDLAAALRALRRHCGDSCRDDRGWFSTHPAFEDRIEALERRR